MRLSASLRTDSETLRSLKGPLVYRALGLDDGAKSNFAPLVRRAQKDAGVIGTISPRSFGLIKKRDLDPEIAAFWRAAAAAESNLPRPRPYGALRVRFALGILTALAEGDQLDPRTCSLAFGDLASGVHLTIVDGALQKIERGDLALTHHARTTGGPSAMAAERLRNRDKKSARPWCTHTRKGPIAPGIRTPRLPRQVRYSAPVVRDLFAP